MKPKSPKSIELYHILIKKGYPEEFCDQITRNLNTDRIFVSLQEAPARGDCG